MSLPVAGLAEPRPKGTSRPGGLLSLEEDAVAVRAVIAGVAGCLQAATMVGHPAPIVAAMATRMHHPVIGDLVMETATPWRADADWYRGFGILVGHRREHTHTDAQWAAEVAEWGDAALTSSGERPSEEIWYVQYGPAAGDVCRWHNAGFLTIHTDRHQFERHLAGTRITTADVLAGDAGFSEPATEEGQ